ncbi:hypothetical protein ACU686_05805 [Yinghuangia aomiensis]
MAASTITAALSLDATVVLLTPVVLATTRRMHGARAKPHLYACAHSCRTPRRCCSRCPTWTNLLAFSATGLTFRRPFRPADGIAVGGRHRRRVRGLPALLRRRPGFPRPRPSPTGTLPMPVFALRRGRRHAEPGFGIASAAGIDPAARWPRQGRGRPGRAGAAPPRDVARGDRAVRRDRAFLAFVLALGIVVRAVVDHGLGTTSSATSCRSGSGLVDLLAVAGRPRGACWPTPSTTCPRCSFFARAGRPARCGAWCWPCCSA